MIEPLVKELLEAGVHFGHQTRRWNPKMRRFIFGAKNGIYIVDLEKTAQGLLEAQDFLRGVAAQGGPILFVGTKKQTQLIIAEESARCGQFYVNLRWLGGLLTNFETIQKSVNRFKTLRGWREDGTLSRLTKKEAAQKENELAKFTKVLSGIIEMGRLPKAIIVVDAKREETAVKEANRLGIPVVGLVDTNTDPDPISFVIPGNDDAVRSIRLVLSRLADAINEGYQGYLAQKAAEEAKRAEEEAKRRAVEEEIARKAEKAAAAKAAAVKTAADAAAVPDLPAAPIAEDELEKILPDADKITEKATGAVKKPKKAPKAKPNIKTQGEA